MGAAMRAEAEAAGDEDVDQENAEDQHQEGSHQETPLEELLDDVVDSLGGEPQTFLVIRDPVRGVNGAWSLRPEARRVILTYLLRNPRETPRSQEELDELVRSLGQPSTHTISRLHEGFDYGMGGSVLMRNAALRSALRRMGVHVSTPTEEGRSGEERENPESEPDHPVHSGGASEEMRSNVSWKPEGQATEEEPRRDKRSGRDKLFDRPRQAESVKKGSGLFEDEPEGVEGLEHEECDYSPTTPEEMEEEMERRFHQLKKPFQRRVLRRWKKKRRKLIQIRMWNRRI